MVQDRTGNISKSNSVAGRAKAFPFKVMKMKRVLISEAEEFEIQFQDGVTKKMVFNMNALRLFQNAMADSGKAIEEIRDQNLLSFILYAGIYAASEKEEFSMEEANALAYIMSPSSGSEITNAFIENIEKGLNPEQRMFQKKLIAQMISRI